MSDNTDETNRGLLQQEAKTNTQCLGAEPIPEQAPTTEQLLQELRIHQIELEMQREELRRTSAALELSQSHYMDLYDFSPVGYITLTPEGVILEINLTGAKLLGLERGKAIHRRFAQFIPDEHKDRWYQLCLLVKQQGGKHSCELPIQSEDGTQLYIHIDLCLHKEASYDSQLLYVVLTDITEQKHAQEALRLVTTSMEMQDGIIVTDVRRVILSVNEAFSRITGYSADEAIGLTPSFLRSGPDNESFYQVLWTSVERYGYWQGEVIEQRKNGEEIPVWLTITAVTGTDGTITHYVKSLTDIRIQNQAEKILLDARERLENQVITSKTELEKIKRETEEINTVLNVLLKRRATDISDSRLALTHAIDSKEDLEKIKQENEEINTVLNVLLKRQAADISDSQAALAREVEETILPFLKKLRSANTGRTQNMHLINILEANIKQLVKTYGCAATLPAAYQQLTPVEMQVASMIRQGLPTKVIAKALNAAPETISTHRKHIRKKLGLNSKASNLYSYLLSLTE